MTEVKRDYYDNGQLKSEVLVINGKKEGEYKKYYKSNKIKEVCTYINDKLHGEHRSYTEQNNNLYCIRKYNNGNMISNPTVYNANGEKLFHIGCE